uniref:Centrosomal protein CEP95 n=1 Tax=Rhipicephalus appendiculatus TaxID=34631 RepID=A0A131YA36_RHIAP
MSDSNAERVCLELVNKIIIQCQLPHPRIGKLSALSHQLVLMLFKACCGIEVPGVIENPRTRVEEAVNVQAALDILANRVLLTSLPHIDSRNVVACDPQVVLHLLEILAGCLDLQGASSSSLSSTLSSPDSSLPVSSSERAARRNTCYRCGTRSGATSHSSPRESSSPDSESFYSEASCFLCDYVAARERSAAAAARSRSHVYPECPSRNQPAPETPSPTTSYTTAESGLDDIDAKKFADGDVTGSYVPRTGFEGRRQGSPYWLRGTPKRKDSESTDSDSSVEERLRATLAELRRRLAEADKLADDERPPRKRPRPVKKSVLLSLSVRAGKRVGSSGTSRKRLRSETEDAPEDESSPDVSMSPHAERVLRRLHEQHVRFAIQSASSTSDVAVDAEQLQRKYEELQERHARKMEQLQRDLARSRRLNELDAQRQLHQAIDALEKDRRQQAARLKRHQDERSRIMRSRRLSYQHRQQQMLQEEFKESIRARKQDLIDIQAAMRERQVREQDRHRVYLASLENFYQTQLSLLTESLAKEKVEMKQRAAAQSRVLERMRRDFKEQLEAETQNLYRLVAEPQEGWVSTNKAVPSQKRSRRV